MFVVHHRRGAAPRVNTRCKEAPKTAFFQKGSTSFYKYLLCSLAVHHHASRHSPRTTTSRSRRSRARATQTRTLSKGGYATQAPHTDNPWDQLGHMSRTYIVSWGAASRWQSRPRRPHQIRPDLDPDPKPTSAGSLSGVCVVLGAVRVRGVAGGWDGESTWRGRPCPH